MMAKTHLSIGIASALALMTVDSPAECAAIIAGGAIGGVIPDVDILDDDYQHDALIGELLALALTAVAAVLDYFFHWGICQSVINNKIPPIIGAVGFLVMWIIGYNQEHREFTHSLLSSLLFTICLALVNIPFGIAAFIGYLSHLLLDLLNKKGIQLFFPKEKKCCLGLFYASKAANIVFMCLGFIAAIALAIYRIVLLQ